MANLIENPTWEAGIYLLEETDPVQGGAEGIDNLQAKQLANRTTWLNQNKQAVDATLTALAALVTAADKLIYATGADTFATTTLSAFIRTLLDDADAATARTTLGAQASDATLTALAAVVTAADKLIYATGVDTFSTATLTAFARTLLDDADAATARTTLGAAPLAAPTFTGVPAAPTAIAGTNTTQLATTAFANAAAAAAAAGLVDSSPGVLDTLNELAAALGDDPNFATTITTALAGKQSLDATLTALAAVVTAADKLIYATGVDTFSTTTLSAFARTLLDDANAAAVLATLGAAPLASPTFTGSPAAPTASVGTNTTQLATTAFANAAAAAIAQPGEICFFARNTAPTGFLKANGASISRTSYSALFAALVKSGAATISIASPCVVTWNSHQLSANDPVKFTTTGALPTGLVAGTTYYVVGASIATNTLQLSATAGGAAINTSGAQSGVHTAINAPFGDGDGATTFTLPDMRDEFPRGWDDGRGGDTNRVFGSAQADELKSHAHANGFSAQTQAGSGGAYWAGAVATNTTSVGGAETRPRNVALLACIRY